VRDLVDWAADLVQATSFVEIGHFARIEMEIGLEVGDRHLGGMPSNTLFSHGEVTREACNAVHVEMNANRGRRWLMNFETQVGWPTRRIIRSKTSEYLSPRLRVDLVGQVILTRRNACCSQNIGTSIGHRVEVLGQADMMLELFIVLLLSLSMAISAAASKFDEVICQPTGNIFNSILMFGVAGIITLDRPFMLLSDHNGLIFQNGVARYAVAER
jgi:hypothetical protein